MAEYFHGVSTRQVDTSVSTPVTADSGIAFVVGAAPAHTVGGSVNDPIMCQSYAEAVAACRARAEEAFSKLNGSADPAHDFAVLAATYSDETDRDQHPSGYTFTVGDGTLPAACEEAAQALEEGQFSGVVEADDGFYLILRKHVDLEAVAPDYFDALLQAAADSADISTTRTYADLDVSRFYDELIAARAELDASGGEVA